MSAKTSSVVFALVALIGTVLVTVSLYTPAQALSSTRKGNRDNCLSCHENLYFLHDTGNWFCLRESPMSCVDCHGGDPAALTEQEAHSERAAHPVLNGDVATCEECHPKECYERVDIFDERAGISQVLVAAPYTPAYSSKGQSGTNIDTAEQQPNGWIMFWEFLPLVLVTGLALIIYLVARRRHT